MNNSRNWRNKSIDQTPDDRDGGGSNKNYTYAVGKRAGSTIAGDR